MSGGLSPGRRGRPAARPPRREPSRLPRVEPIVVEVTRGDLVESRHAVHAVAVQSGAVVLEAGDPRRLAFMRSSAKPFQALPVVRARPDLDDEEVAIACASHLARPEQIAAVRSLLARAPATESELECGPEPTPLEHNCSGKHAGMLALCRAEGWESGGYRLAGHPVQDACLREVASAADVDPGTVPTALDGCGVLTFALTLDRMALAFARLPAIDGGDRIARAMQAFPDHIRGPLAADSLLMRHAAGWTAKGGAEGLLCAAGPQGVGLALKVEDGNTRAARPALREVLRRLGTDVPELAPVALENSRGERVGELRSKS
jgi:L-asparaginase II